MHSPRNIQSPYVAADFWTNHSSVNPRMCTLIKITSKFGDVIGLTSNTRDMTMPGHSGVTFHSTPGISPSLVEQALDESTNLEMTGLYQTGIFEQQDVINGIWNFADVEVFTTSWGNVNLGELVYMKGNLGEFKDYQTYFNAEGRGQLSRLANDVNECTSRFCRVLDFGDAQCGKSLAGTVTIDGDTFNLRYTNIECAGAVDKLTVEFTIDTPPDGLPASLDTAGLFTNGKLEGTSGNNDGIAREIASVVAIFPGYRVLLKRPLPFTPTGGDTFTLTAGCARTINDCMKFGNIVNRRAEDYIPGLEAVNRIPSGN